LAAARRDALSLSRLTVTAYTTRGCGSDSLVVSETGEQDAVLACLCRKLQLEFVFRVTARRWRVWDDASVAEACEQLVGECAG
jgi:hypothetical protein